jgi:EpsI family protein
VRQASALQSPGTLLVALLLIALALYYESVVSLVELWTQSSNTTYQHGLLLVAICVVLFWRRWAEVRGSMQVRPSATAALLVLLVSFVWLLASLVNVLIVQQLSLVLLIGLLVVSAVGYRAAWLFSFPVALLLFAVPVWDPLVPYLQRLTAKAATLLVNLSGVPAVLEGTRIGVPVGAFDVLPSCSGVSQLVVGTLAAALFSYIKRLPRATAVWLVALAAGVSMLTNVLRVYAVVILQPYFAIDHMNLGWTMFGISMVIFFALTSRLTAPGARASSTAAQSAGPPAVARDETSAIRSALLSAAALLFGPALVYAYQLGPALVYADQPERGATAAALQLPAEMGGWQAAAPGSGGYRPVFDSPDLEYEGVYRDAQSRQVYLYVARYLRQEQGKEAVYVGNRVYDADWQTVLTRNLELRTGGTVRETRLESRNGAEKLVWQWYYVHGFTVASGFMAKLVNAWGALNQDPAITAMVVATDLKDGYDSSQATTVLMRFVADTRPTLERAIDSSPKGIQ